MPDADKPFEILAGRCGTSSCPVQVSVDEAEAQLKSSVDLVWIHVIFHDKVEAARLLIDRFKLNEREVMKALDDRHIADVHDHPDMLFAKIPVAVSEGAVAEEYHELSLFLGKRYLITVTDDDIEVIRTRFDLWMKQVISKKESAAGILHGVIDAVVDAYFPLSDAIQDEVEDLEDRLFESKGIDVRDALKLKQRLLSFRKRVAPLRDAINAMLRRDNSLIPSAMWPYFHDVYDHTLRLVELTDVDRDILSSILDAHLSIVSNRLNEVMRYLAVVSTILMSVTLVSSIYGMNFTHMPELRQPWAYPAVLGLMLFIGLGQWLWFRRKGWV